MEVLQQKIESLQQKIQSLQEKIESLQLRTASLQLRTEVQPEGLQESSRWSESAETTGSRRQ